MKAVQSTLFVSILTLLFGVSVPAQADPSLQPNALSAHDLELLFEQDGEPVQLALLSEQEMRETKGALTAWVARYAFGGIAGAMIYIMENLGTGRFYADEFGAYMVMGALTAGGHGVGYTEGGENYINRNGGCNSY